MEEERYSNFDIRGRIEVVSNEVTKLGGELKGHGELCALRYKGILEEQKYQRWILFMVFGIELGKAAWPAVVEVLSKVPH